MDSSPQSGPLVRDFPLLTADEAARVRADVLALRERWRRRSPDVAFFTLGAAAYLDAADGRFDEYIRRAREDNQLLRDGFGWLHRRLAERVAAITGGVVASDERLGLPGFHVFEIEDGAPQRSGALHYDLQYRLIDWQAAPTRPHDQLSLTVAIALPAAGTGLRIWDIDLRRTATMPPAERRAWVEAHRGAVMVPYAVGRLAVHSGHHLHQIPALADPRPGDERITLQAHALPVGDRWILYW